MHDQSAVITFVTVKLLPNPKKIILGLLVQRHAGANTRMCKEAPVLVMCRFQPPQKRLVCVGYSRVQKLCKIGFANAVRQVNIIRGDGFRATNRLMKPVIAHQQMRIEARAFGIKIPFKEPVMITLEAHPIAPVR